MRMEEGRNRERLVFGVCAGVLAVLLACTGTAARAFPADLAQSQVKLNSC